MCYKGTHGQLLRFPSFMLLDWQRDQELYRLLLFSTHVCLASSLNHWFILQNQFYPKCESQINAGTKTVTGLQWDKKKKLKETLRNFYSN
jgi:hypothetical protein